ncbi:hypothetical protein RBU61_05265 [Tissierella sp. MB52-C2]|uniref:hypothetical protein n=1 Tax=Tissierella sp. MB52-C2 TaxID=3070999 RepID=UPI00280A77AE|nr:hypothetical protein [Tissierella sp. MB52-C2]WMM26087.1 hypothetical protein RBU61_05265 [Tissierella sp. MB52-C2]
MKNKIYDTERLTLKVLDKSLAQIVLDYYLRNRSFLREWEPVRSEEFYTKTFMDTLSDKVSLTLEQLD